MSLLPSRPALALLLTLATAARAQEPTAPDGEPWIRAEGPAVVRARAAALLLSGLEGGSIRSALLVAPPPAGEDGTLPVAVAVAVEIDGTSLLAAGGGEPGALEVILYALTGGDEVATTASHRFHLEPDCARELLSGAGLELLTALHLPAGEYDLRLLVESGGAFGLVTAPLTVPGEGEPDPPPRVAEPGRWRTALTAARVESPEGRSSPESLPPAPPPRPVTAVPLPSPELRAAYAAALGRLAAGDDAAAAAVAEIEEGALTGRDPGETAAALTALEGAEWAVIEELLATDPEAALPVVLLHADLAREHRRRGRPPLAAHALRLAGRLAEAYAATAATAEARRLAAGALASLAGDLADAGSEQSACELFRRSLALDGEDAAALLGLAVLDERHGRASDAKASLERLVALEPRHPEARLRLAVNLLRAGQSARGRRLLGELAAEGRTWIASLAHQELARLDLAAGDCRRAAVTLRRAARRWPDRPEIGILLAWSLDCQGRRREAREVLADLAAAGRAVSDRYRYAHRPREELAAGRLLLAEAAGRRHGDLGRALAPAAPEAGG